jgi:hypothetical protein
MFSIPKCIVDMYKKKIEHEEGRGANDALISQGIRSSSNMLHKCGLPCTNCSNSS